MYFVQRGAALVLILCGGDKSGGAAGVPAVRDDYWCDHTRVKPDTTGAQSASVPAAAPAAPAPIPCGCDKTTQERDIKQAKGIAGRGEG